MTRAQLKSKAKSQINGNIFILFLCHFIVYVVANLSFIAEIAARIFFYPAHLTGLLFQISANPGVKYVISAFNEIIKRSYINEQSAQYFKVATDSILAQPAYPVGISMLISLASIISFIIVPSFNLGIRRLYLNLTKGEKPSIDKFLSGVTSVGKTLWLDIIIKIFTFLWTLLLIVPGIIKYMSYSMSFYILSENPEFTAREALNESKRLMDGHKMDYFILMFSFIWWYILAGITFGLAYIYVYPYINATTANFYQEIKSAENNSSPSDSETQKEYEDGFEKQ